MPADRVPPAQSSSSRSTPAPSGRPMDTQNLDQAASQFSNLMSDTNDTSSSTARSPSPTSDETQSSPSNDRVEERQDDSGQDDGRSDDGDKSGSDKEQAASKFESMSMGDAILQSLQKGEAPVKTEGPAQAQMPDSNNLEGIVQEVADRILVSDPSTGNREVRITLKDSILPGTEVRMSQVNGKLQVQFVTDSSRSMETLAQNQAALQERLNDKLGKQDVVVNVAMESANQGDAQDGRSRQQRDVAEEAEED